MKTALSAMVVLAAVAVAVPVSAVSSWAGSGLSATDQEAAEFVSHMPAAAWAEAPSDTLAPDPREIPGLLESEEGRARGLEGIRARAGELSGRRATLWIQLLAVAEKGGPEAGALAARALLHVDDDAAARGAQLIREGLEGAAAEDRPALLALAAHLLDGPDPSEAAELRARLLELAPDAPEAPEAALRLARYLAGPGNDPQRAEELLEELVVGAPNHPVAPTARQLLNEIRRDR